MRLDLEQWVNNREELESDGWRAVDSTSEYVVVAKTAIGGIQTVIQSIYKNQSKLKAVWAYMRLTGKSALEGKRYVERLMID